ncbi:MAG: citramalate synthase, partial [Ruminococcaceae bacterium]|nr:citramalate synthase [Oscillospiraceae bacterium]
AVEAGVTHVQGSFTGIGERCGNTALCQLIPSLQEKMGYHCIYPEGMTSLGVAARYISDLSNTRLPDGTPYVGSSAFSHKAGTHVDALQKLPGAYEHIDPRVVGNERRFLASELAGRAAILEKIQRVAPDIQAGDPAVDRVLASLKDLENRGWQFDSADASMEVLILRTLGRLPEYYTPEFFNVSDSFPLAGDTTGCLATVKIRVGEQTALECAEGDGPVHAMDTALRKCLASFYPSMGDMRLLVYKVRVTSPGETTAARVRVLINSTDGKRIWTTIGTSRDIIRASWKALSDSVDYHLYHQEF